nr:MAG TPA: hypothetical protein [Bacteriophage sp.]
MYNQTITLFNYSSDKDEYFKTLIENVEIQPNYQTVPNLSQTDSNTSVLIIFEYSEDEIGKYIYSRGKKVYYSKPKNWDISSGEFTMQNNTDFIIIGDYTNIENVNLNEIKNSIDDVFVINQFKVFFDELKHFELYVN